VNLCGRPQTYWRKAWDSDLCRIVPGQGLASVEIGRFESNPETNRRAESPRLRSTGAFEPVLAEKARLHRGGRFVVAVQHVRIEVDAVRPGESSGNRVDCDCSETRVVVVDRGEHSRQGVGKVEFAHETIGERDPQRTLAEMLDGSHSGQNRLLRRVHPARLLPAGGP
jgi:hypothetical protein